MNDIIPKGMPYCEAIAAGEIVALNSTEDGTFFSTTGYIHRI
ncbi:hypothetical protein [Methylomonas methanica]|nr:hypothetical protein [Methylomonas methanica]